MSAPTVPDVIAVAALLLAIFNTVRAEWWHKRTASLEARLERYKVPASHPLLEERARIVVVNHGPAVARDVEVHLRDETGAPSEVVTPDFRGERRIPRLHATQQYHLSLIEPAGVYLPGLPCCGGATNGASGSASRSTSVRRT